MKGYVITKTQRGRYRKREKRQRIISSLSGTSLSGESSAWQAQRQRIYRSMPLAASASAPLGESMKTAHISKSVNKNNSS